MWKREESWTNRSFSCQCSYVSKMFLLVCEHCMKPMTQIHSAFPPLTAPDLRNSFTRSYWRCKRKKNVVFLVTRTHVRSRLNYFWWYPTQCNMKEEGELDEPLFFESMQCAYLSKMFLLEYGHWLRPMTHIHSALPHDQNTRSLGSLTAPDLSNNFTRPY